MIVFLIRWVLLTRMAINFAKLPAREHRHKTNVKDEEWQQLETGANH